MKSLERRFAKFRTKNIYWSSYLCFAEAVRGQYFSAQAIRRWFNKLVEKDDYAMNEKRTLFSFLFGLSNTPRTTEKSPTANAGDEKNK